MTLSVLSDLSDSGDLRLFLVFCISRLSARGVFPPTALPVPLFLPWERARFSSGGRVVMLDCGLACVYWEEAGCFCRGHIKSENVQSIAVTALECMNCRLHRKIEKVKKRRGGKGKAWRGRGRRGVQRSEQGWFPRLLLLMGRTEKQPTKMYLNIIGL